MLKRSDQQLGFTFTELMVALAINAILFAALTTVFLSNIDQYRRSINMYRLDQQMQIAMHLMTADIRRAGYWGNADSDINASLNNNPFMASSTDITTGLSGACILFSYDHDYNGSVAAISDSGDDEHYGFRLNGNTLQGRPPGAAFSCTSSATNWEDITDPNLMQITALSFTLNTSTITVGPGTKGLTVRSVTISMTGQLTSDSTVTKTLTTTIKVRNDKFNS